MKALANDYLALQRLLDKADLERMTREYVAAQPLRHVNLRWQGDERARQLSNSLPWRRRLPLAELARFAWELGLAFDAADEPLTSVKDTARVPADCWPGVRLRLHPSVQLRQIRNDAPQVWRAASARRKPVVAMRRPPVHSLVWREGHEPRYRAARPGAGRGRARTQLARCMKGGVAAPCTQRARDTARRALLKGWLEEELVRAIGQRQPFICVLRSATT